MTEKHRTPMTNIGKYKKYNEKTTFMRGNAGNEGAP